jgi:hypothetical protein
MSFTVTFMKLTNLTNPLPYIGYYKFRICSFKGDVTPKFSIVATSLIVNIKMGSCWIYTNFHHLADRLRGLVVRVPGYRSWGPGFDSRLYQIFWDVVGLERGSLSLVKITEELFEWKSSGFGQENRINDGGIRCADHATPSNSKSWH